MVGPEGPQGEPGPEGPQGPPGPLLRVFDGEGNVLGIPNGRGGWFFNQEMGLSVTWATARGENSGARIFYFTEENCEGQAFLELHTNRTFFNALIGPYPSPFPTYYVASADAAPQLIQTASELSNATCSPRDGGDPQKVIPAVPFTGTLPFTIPVPEPIYVGIAP